MNAQADYQPLFDLLAGMAAPWGAGRVISNGTPAPGIGGKSSCAWATVGHWWPLWARQAGKTGYAAQAWATVGQFGPGEEKSAAGPRAAG